MVLNQMYGQSTEIKIIKCDTDSRMLFTILTGDFLFQSY